MSTSSIAFVNFVFKFLKFLLFVHRQYIRSKTSFRENLGNISTLSSKQRGILTLENSLRELPIQHGRRTGFNRVL